MAEHLLDHADVYALLETAASRRCAGHHEPWHLAPPPAQGWISRSASPQCARSARRAAWRTPGHGDLQGTGRDAVNLEDRAWRQSAAQHHGISRVQMLRRE